MTIVRLVIPVEDGQLLDPRRQIQVGWGAEGDAGSRESNESLDALH